MTKRINHIAPLQLGIVLAAIYGALSLIFVPFIFLASMIGAKSAGNHGFPAGGTVLLIFLPFLYAALGFVGGVLAAAVYNLIARWTGGIELTLADVPER